jgi:ATP phosphoribosyltransferase
MANLSTKNVKLAIQKDGRLTEETLEFLRSSGLDFESSKQRLFSLCRNFPLEILYVRYDDIPNYVQSGTVDLGIFGQSLFNEVKPKVKNILNLGYGFCSLVVAVPKESSITSIKNMKNIKIATSYPNCTKRFFDKNKVPITILGINGSVEITPALGVADAICDLVSTGSTLTLNDLKPIIKIFDSIAILVANEKSLQSKEKNVLIKKLLTRFNGVLTAKSYKYVLMNIPEKILLEIKKFIPGLKSPTVSSLTEEGWISVQTVVKEDVFWETIEQLKILGATDIIVLPIEKMIL